VKSIVKTTTVILEKTTTRLVVPGGDGAGKSMFSLAHAAMCLLNMLRSSVKTYREEQEEERFWWFQEEGEASIFTKHANVRERCKIGVRESERSVIHGRRGVRYGRL
jgi:hypothetical protein